MGTTANLQCHNHGVGNTKEVCVILYSLLPGHDVETSLTAAGSADGYQNKGITVGTTSQLHIEVCLRLSQ